MLHPDGDITNSGFVDTMDSTSGFAKWYKKIPLDSMNIANFGNMFNMFNMFPNPATNYLTIYYRLNGTKKNVVEIYNLKGQKEFIHELPAESDFLSLPVRNVLTKGAKQLMIKSNGKIFYRELIIIQ